MPWSNKGGGGWQSGGGPWGGNGSSSGGGGPQQPDLEEILKRGQDKLKKAMPGRFGGGGASTTFLVLLLIVGLAVVGFFGFTVRVNPDELGVVLRFGKYSRQLPPGLNFRWPYPIEEVYLPKVTRENRTEIGIRGSGETRFGTPSGRDVPEESLMLTGDENIVDVDFIVLWQIKDAEKYLFNIERPDRTLKEVAESAMREVVGQSDIQPILTEQREEAELAVQKLIQSILDSYGAGIQINGVKMQKADPPAQVIDAFRDVQAARADQERLKNQAETYANRIVPEARGEAERIIQAAVAYKERVVAEAKGQTDRFLKVLKEYQKAPDITRKRMFLETMEKVLGRTDKIIVDGKTGGAGVVPYLPLSELGTKTPKRGGQQ